MVSRLLATKQGCGWLLERWQALGAALMERGTWTEAQRVLAVNLLGTPAEFRDDPVWHTPADVVSDEVARLLLLKSTALDPLDALERAAAEKGLAVEPSEALTKVRRYEAACMRQFQWRATGCSAAPPTRARRSPSRERRRGPIARDVGMRPGGVGAGTRSAPDPGGDADPTAAANADPAAAQPALPDHPIRPRTRQGDGPRLTDSGSKSCRSEPTFTASSAR